MATPRLKSAPTQSATVYKLLAKHESLTARQIAEGLNILPNTVYRAVRPLIELGIVEETNDYPVAFRAVPKDTAMDWYLRAATQSFRLDFGGHPVINKESSVPAITFIKDREQLLRLTEQEARKATKTLNYIVSGHSVPDSTVLAYRKAATVGVKIRAIIQNTPETTHNPLENYHDMGVEVRYLPNIGIRLFIFDSKTAILTSYDTSQSSRAFGIRFTYAPVAEQLDRLFQQRWEEAKPLV